jgi:hypothetical protein
LLRLRAVELGQHQIAPEIVGASVEVGRAYDSLRPSVVFQEPAWGLLAESETMLQKLRIFVFRRPPGKISEAVAGRGRKDNLGLNLTDSHYIGLKVAWLFDIYAEPGIRVRNASLVAATEIDLFGFNVQDQNLSRDSSRV